MILALCRIHATQAHHEFPVQYRLVSECLTGVQKIMHWIPVNDSDVSLFHAQDIVLNSSLTTTLAPLYFHPQVEDLTVILHVVIIKG